MYHVGGGELAGCECDVIECDDGFNGEAPSRVSCDLVVDVEDVWRWEGEGVDIVAVLCEDGRRYGETPVVCERAVDGVW